MKVAIQKFSQTEDKTRSDVIDGVRSIGKGLVNLGLAVRDCDRRLDGRERKLFTDITSYFYEHSLQDSCYAVGLNVVVNGVDIYKQIDAAFTAYLAKEYEDFGRDVGAAFALTFIGNGVTSSDAACLRTM